MCTGDGHGYFAVGISAARPNVDWSVISHVRADTSPIVQLVSEQLDRLQSTPLASRQYCLCCHDKVSTKCRRSALYQLDPTASHGFPFPFMIKSATWSQRTQSSSSQSLSLIRRICIVRLAPFLRCYCNATLATVHQPLVFVSLVPLENIKFPLTPLDVVVLSYEIDESQMLPDKCLRILYFPPSPLQNHCGAPLLFVTAPPLFITYMKLVVLGEPDKPCVAICAPRTISTGTISTRHNCQHAYLQFLILLTAQ